MDRVRSEWDVGVRVRVGDWPLARRRACEASAVATSPRERQHIVCRACIQDIVGFQPSLARYADADDDVVETGDGMGVRSDLDDDAALLRLSQKAPVEIEPTRIRVELDRRAGFRGLLDDRLHIDGVSLAREQETP